MKLRELPVISGTNAASKFFVLGEREGLICAVRIWLEGTSQHTMIGFRLRITKDPESEVEVLNLQQKVSSLFPNIKWTGGSPQHVSIQGGFSIDRGVTHAAEISKALADNHAEEVFAKRIYSTFEWFEFGFTADELTGMLGEEIQLIVKEAQPPLPQGSLAVVISLGEYKGTYKQGFLVKESGVDNEKSALESVGLGGGDAPSTHSGYPELGASKSPVGATAPVAAKKGVAPKPTQKPLKLKSPKPIPTHHPEDEKGS